MKEDPNEKFKDDPIYSLRGSRELGYAGKKKWIKAPCADCNKPRWVPLNNYKREKHMICPSCALRKQYPLPDDPNILETARADTLGWKGSRALAVKMACPRCGQERWRLRQEYLRNPEALCKACSSLHRNENGCMVTKDGYVMVPIPFDHPYVKRHKGRNRILEHRLVMSEVLKRALGDREQVHHLNGVRTDNRPDNLALVQPEEHTMLTNQCRDCPLRIEVRLLRWQQMELLKALGRFPS